MANESSDSHPVFVETNLDTHIVMVVTDQDTVAGFKEKVSVGHYSCFPDIGEITVHSLKVRRNGNFYHILNSVPIKSAFEGVKKNWFLFADATRSQGKATLDCKKDSNNIHQNLSKDLDMGGASGGSKLENRMDALENTSTSGGRKRKKKKRKRTQTESVQPDTETEMNKKDVGSSHLSVTFAVMETENPESKRRKKAEESNGAEAKSHTHVNSAEDIVPLTSEQEKAFDDNLGTKESILLRTEDRQLSKVCSVDDDKFDENSILQNGGPKMVPEAKSTMSSIRDRNVSTIDAAVSTEIPDFSDKSEKKSKKTKAADSHANSAINIIPLTAEQESSFDGDLGTKKESMLFQTENRQLSEVFPHDNDKIDKQSVLDNENTKMVPEAKGTVSNIRDIDISVTDAAIPTEVQNPTAKKRKKSKKSKASNAEWKVSTSEAEHVESSENAIQSICKSHRPSVQDHFRAETKGGDKIFSQTEDVEVAKLESPNTQERRFHDKDCQGAGHEDASLQLAQVVRIQESTDDIDDKVDHNVSKPSLSTSNLVEDQGMMEQVAHTENLLLSTKGKKEEGKASRKKRKSKSKTDNSVNESCNIGPESGTVSEYEAKSLQQQELSGHVLSPQLPSNAVNCSVAGPCLVNESRDGTNDVEGDKLESPNTRERRFHDKDCQGAAHEDGSLLLAQVVRIQGSTDDTDDKVNCNVNKPSVSTSNLVKDQGMMEQVAPLLSTKGKKEEGRASRRKSKSKSKTDNSELDTVSEFEAKSLPQQELSGHFVSPQLPSNAVNSTVAVPCLVNESRDGSNDVEVDKLESPNTRESRFHDKDCQGAAHEDVSLQLAQDVRIQGSTDDTDDKVNHNVSKPSVSTSNLVKDQGMMEQVAPLLSTKGKKEGGRASRRKSKSKSKPDNSVNELCNIGPQSDTVSEFEAKSLQKEELSGHVVSPNLPPNAVNCSVAGPCLVNGSSDGTNDGDKVNFRNYFVAKNVSQVITPAKELEPVKRDAHQAKHDKKLKIDKKAKPCTLNSLGTSSDLEKPHAEIENQGHKKKTVSAIPNTSQLQRSNSEPHSNGSSLNTARKFVLTLLADNDKVKASPINVSRDKVVDSSKELKAQHEVQFHSPSGSYVHTSKVNSKAAKISFVEKTEDVANGSQNHKSLSDVPKEVFSESSTESYEDKGDEKQDSDASTMSPSDTSDDSDGESEVDLNSPGSSWRHITKNGGNRKTRSQTTILKNMDLQSILRGSRSYKKAKLTASQSQPEDELPPPPFDLDG